MTDYQETNDIEAIYFDEKYPISYASNEINCWAFSNMKSIRS